MSVILEDRPIESVRGEIIDQLIMNYSHGELSYEAFERRLDQAMELQSHQLLVELVKDLPLTVDKAFVESKKQDLAPNIVMGDTEEVEYIINVFSGNTRSGAWTVPKEIRSFSVFSGCDIDLTDAIFTQRELRIKVFSLFSGSNIYIPENVNVVSKAFCIFGGIDYQTAAPVNPHIVPPTIIIEGVCIFSGVDIKVKRTIKEKFVEMANNFKKLFS
ncbi:cell wall-active antibiotics response protein [Colwellia sp. MSW7]|jgi:hypothetical protein|uniref:Cell wall-active antibiotics response protein n=1 Tax=Colwellia maritima TaxID=2912588 RepID=A0ABS9X0V2_9GAMM|nr:LiaF domain-containing protein [Colwellia maritima]MCI2283853.1 cell wall-active antibiotics response protein [Colwellia maritima]